MLCLAQTARSLLKNKPPTKHWGFLFCKQNVWLLQAFSIRFFSGSTYGELPLSPDRRIISSPTFITSIDNPTSRGSSLVSVT